MLDSFLTSDPCNGVTMMGVRNIYDHMMLKDCYEAGLISEDEWRSYLKQLINIETTALDFAKPLETVTEFADRCRECGKMKTGHWIDSSNGWMCSECKRDNTYDTNFCPYCGCRMVEPQERSDEE